MIKTLQKYAVFSGRSQRSEYWYFMLFITIGFIVTLIIDIIFTMNFGSEENPIIIFTSIFSLAIIVPAYSVTIRRFHDIGKSGWLLLIGFIPLIGLIFMIIWMTKDSMPEENEYGKNPKKENNQTSKDNESVQPSAKDTKILKKKLENKKDLPMDDKKELSTTTQNSIVQQKTKPIEPVIEQKEKPSLDDIKQLLLQMQETESKEIEENTKDIEEIPISKKEDSISNKRDDFLNEIKTITPYINKLGYKIDEIEIDLISINNLILYVSQNKTVSIIDKERVLKYCKDKDISMTLLFAIIEALKIENNQNSSTKIEIDLTSNPSIKMKLKKI